MASSRISRNLFWSSLWIYSLATGLASMIFMGWAFYVETTGRGALFIEPNRVLAAGELATVATGMIALLVLFFRGLSQKESVPRSEEHTSELQSQSNLVCRLL